MNVEEVYLLGELSDDGETILLDQPKIVGRVLKNWIGKKLDITLKVFFEKRTLRQNRYLHAVIVQMVKAWRKETHGEVWSNEQAKAYIYYFVLGYEMNSTQIDGKEFFWFEGKHFSEMSTKEFNTAKETIQAHFAPLGWDIPDPKGASTLTEYINDLQ